MSKFNTIKNRKRGKVLEYFIFTGIVWGWYATILPLWMHFFVGMSWEQITTWLWQGTIIEFIIAYPLAKILFKVKHRVVLFCQEL